jgi:hypothetical protein
MIQNIIKKLISWKKIITFSIYKKISVAITKMVHTYSYIFEVENISLTKKYS